MAARFQAGKGRCRSLIHFDRAGGIRFTGVLRAVLPPGPRRADAADEIESRVEVLRQRRGDFARTNAKRVEHASSLKQERNLSQHQSAHKVTCHSPLNRIKISLYDGKGPALPTSAQLPFDDLNAALKAAGEPTRLRMLALLSEAELTVSDFTEILG